MGLFKKIGKSALLITYGADRLGEGMDMVFGENRTRPEDGFSKDRAGQKAAAFTQQAKKSNKSSLSEMKQKEKEEFF